MISRRTVDLLNDAATSHVVNKNRERIAISYVVFLD